MSTREKKNTEAQQQRAVEAQPMSRAREQVETLRERATELLATARNVIDDTLSSESEQYLNSVRQQGGQ
jgi:hypothetical protein